MSHEFGTFLQLLLRSLETGSVFALAALGIIIVYRTSLVAHFAQGSMAMFNTFVVSFAFSSLALPLWASVLCGIISAIVTGFLVDILIIRHAKKVSHVGKQIITMGLIMVFLGLTPVLFGVDSRQLPRFIPRGDLAIGTASISYNAMLNIFMGLALMSALFFILQKTKIGLAVRTTASNESTARLMGVPTRSITLMAWAVAGVLGVLSGVMIAPATTVNVTLMDNVQISAFFACVLGGFQTFYGPVLGAYIIAIASNLMIYYVDSVWGNQIIYMLILIFLIFRPNGLVGKNFIKKV